MEAALARYPLLVRSLEEAPIVARGAYDYFVHPLADGIPRVSPELLDEAARGLAAHLEEARPDIDVLLTAEAMGLPLVAAVATRLGVPYVTARKRGYGLAGERALHQRTGYGEATLHVNDLAEGERVAIVDDVISTGGTLRTLAKGIADTGAHLVSVASVFSKDRDLDALATALECPVGALVVCTVDDAGTRKRVRVVATDVRG